MAGQTENDALLTEHPGLRTVKSGEIKVSATAAALPDIACSLVMFKANAANTGKIYLGGAGVTVANGTTDAVTGFELSAGNSTPLLPIDNLKRLYQIGTVTDDSFTYLALK